jgi:hypothetical protein
MTDSTFMSMIYTLRCATLDYLRWNHASNASAPESISINAHETFCDPEEISAGFCMTGMSSVTT